MTVKLPTEHPLKYLRLKGGCTASSESTLVKNHFVGNHMSRLNFMHISLKVAISFNIHEVRPRRKRGGGYRQKKTPADHFLGHKPLFYKKVILNT